MPNQVFLLNFPLMLYLMQLEILEMIFVDFDQHQNVEKHVQRMPTSRPLGKIEHRSF